MALSQLEKAKRGAKSEASSRAKGEAASEERSGEENAKRSGDEQAKRSRVTRGAGYRLKPQLLARQAPYVSGNGGTAPAYNRKGFSLSWPTHLEIHSSRTKVRAIDKQQTRAMGS